MPIDQDHLSTLLQRALRKSAQLREAIEEGGLHLENAQALLHGYAVPQRPKRRDRPREPSKLN